MIGFLSGVIQSKSESQAVVDVGGVGYEVHLSRMALAGLGETGESVRLEIHTHVTESSFQLYGFLSADEKTLFKKLISVSGIGPKMGLNIVSAYPFDDLVSCIVRGDLHALTKIGGIGKKTAERIVIELKDKFKNMPVADRSRAVGPVYAGGDHREVDALQALLSLGYSEAAARMALQKVGLFHDDTVQTLIKKSLGAMAS